MSHVLSSDPENFPIPVFRIYIENAAEMSAVRLVEMGDVYVTFDELLKGPVDNLPDPTEANDKNDSPIFQELLKRRQRGRHAQA